LEHGRRAIPLGWVVLKGNGTTQVEKLKKMLQAVAELLRQLVGEVTFLADRGFRDCDWAALCVELGWHYAIRITSNTLITKPDEHQAAVEDFGVNADEKQYFQNVHITQAKKLIANLSVGWTCAKRGEAAELIAIISDLPAGPARFDDYARRMCIEQSFRDDQSSGFDLEHTQLTHPERLERLLLAVALAVIWCHELGELVLSDEKLTKAIDVGGKHRELSLFQLGLRHFKRCLVITLGNLPAPKLALSNIPPAPVRPRIRLAV
jgi:hypothetical protein